MGALLFYGSVAFLTTFSGSLVPLLNHNWDKKHVWRMLAFGSGLLLGIAFLHLLPEAFELAGKGAGIALLVTFVILFSAEHFTMVHSCEEFMEPPKAPFIPLIALIALTVHGGLDGMAIGVGLRQDSALGGVISLGVILHKFSDGFTLTSLLQAAGYPKAKRWALSLVLALATPLGAFLSFYSAGPLPGAAIGAVLGVATGSFLYVGAADLLPRLHEAHDRYCVLFFALGTAVVGFMR
jgi:zinc and cadmium transporter